MTGLMAYMAYLMGDIADLAREHMCTERSTAGRPSSSRDPATRPGTDEVLVELDPPTEDEESDAGTEEEDNMMTMQLWCELKDGDERALMQTFAESNHPVYGMLVETFVVALQKHDEKERANIAAHMLKLLRDGARNGTASMSEQAETLEAALVVFSEGASTTVLGSSAHSDWVKHWWSLLAPHLARDGACESRSGQVVGPESLRRRRDPNYGTDHSFGIPPEDMLAAVVEAEEEERHLRRLNTYQPGEPAEVVDQRVDAARALEVELSDEAERDEADSLMWDELRRDRDAEEAGRWRQRRDEEQQAARALRIEDWAEWQNREDVRLTAEAREAKAMEEKDWAQWTNRQVQQSEAQLRQRDAARYRDWEQWVLLNTPPSGSTRTRREYRVEAAVFVDGKQAVKKARWSIAMALTAKVGFHFTMEPQEVSSVQGLVEGGRPADTSEAMGSGTTSQGQGWPGAPETAGGVNGEVSGAPYRVLPAPLLCIRRARCPFRLVVLAKP